MNPRNVKLLDRILRIAAGSPSVPSGGGHCTERSGLWSFFDRVNTLGVEGEIILDRRDGSVWGLITPHSIDRTLAAERNAEVAAIPLVRAVGRAICPRQ